MLSCGNHHTRNDSVTQRQTTHRAARGGTWAVEFYLHHNRSAPAEKFLDECPVGKRLLAIIEAVRGYPPPSFPSSQIWHVMSGRMAGIYEARVRSRDTLYRLFCVLDRKAESFGLDAPTLTLLSGGTKPVGEAMHDDVYDDAIVYRDRYLRTQPRPIKR